MVRSYVTKQKLISRSSGWNQVTYIILNFEGRVFIYKVSKTVFSSFYIYLLPILLLFLYYLLLGFLVFVKLFSGLIWNYHDFWQRAFKLNQLMKTLFWYFLYLLYCLLNTNMSGVLYSGVLYVWNFLQLVLYFTTENFN